MEMDLFYFGDWNEQGGAVNKCIDRAIMLFNARRKIDREESCEN